MHARSLRCQSSAQHAALSTHHLELTAEGRTFRDRAAVALVTVDDALDPARVGTWPLRLGHAWSAMGRWTTPLLRRWQEEHPDTPLELLRIDDRSAGLLGGRVDVALLRGALPQEEAGRPHTCRLPAEDRIAAVPADSELATREAPVTLADLARHPVALNTVSGLTTLALWPEELRPHPSRVVEVANTDDWLGAIAAGRAAGASTSATAEMHPHPGVVYRPLAGVEPVPVRLVWRGVPGHPAIPALVELAQDVLRVRPEERD